ncbi:hypothetical protein DKT77_03400 [Meridianimarinicoccus roseus]|uniref:SIMPL domain-containing protein n=1 Tax=Meridianimarinicoccus roseus TaxID=2072018 RepID=A0A2V2LET8_9RHOB|nr:SIMPL domain-containing protein [Meridianimarinicoccus roseus]PWR04100.1 hypothetical protein DKT77_03400 [Meridianimarinicoccus roseus]
MFRYILAACAAVVALAGPLTAQDAGPARVITVTGEGAVRAAPDMVTLRLGVLAEGRTASDAIDRMSADAARLLAALDAAGVPATDVQTTMLDLRPIREQNAAEPRRALRITGFEAETQVSVTSTDMAGLGDLFDRVLEAGANRVSGISFGLQDTENAMNQARAAAVRDAVSKARVYADAAGVPLGAVLRITDAPGASPFDAAPRMMAAEGAMPIAPGSLRLTAQVSVTLAIGE